MRRNDREKNVGIVLLTRMVDNPKIRVQTPENENFTKAAEKIGRWQLNHWVFAPELWAEVVNLVNTHYETKFEI